MPDLSFSWEALSDLMLGPLFSSPLSLCICVVWSFFLLMQSRNWVRLLRPRQQAGVFAGGQAALKWYAFSCTHFYLYQETLHTVSIQYLIVIANLSEFASQFERVLETVNPIYIIRTLLLFSLNGTWLHTENDWNSLEDSMRSVWLQRWT